eukprot:8473461-Prorocentrum_lima.AAC.1
MGKEQQERQKAVVGGQSSHGGGEVPWLLELAQGVQPRSAQGERSCQWSWQQAPSTPPSGASGPVVWDGSQDPTILAGD